MAVLVYLMLHIKFQGNQSIGSEEKQRFTVLTIYRHSSHVGHVIPLFKQLYFPLTWRLHIISEEKSFEIVDRRRTTDNRAWLSYKLPHSLRLRRINTTAVHVMRDSLSMITTLYKIKNNFYFKTELT